MLSLPGQLHLRMRVFELAVLFTDDDDDDDDDDISKVSVCGSDHFL